MQLFHDGIFLGGVVVAGKSHGVWLHRTIDVGTVIPGNRLAGYGLGLLTLLVKFLEAVVVLLGLERQDFHVTALVNMGGRRDVGETVHGPGAAALSALLATPLEAPVALVRLPSSAGAVCLRHDGQRWSKNEYRDSK